jgi:hypothetical protein
VFEAGQSDGSFCFFFQKEALAFLFMAEAVPGV